MLYCDGGETLYGVVNSQAFPCNPGESCEECKFLMTKSNVGQIGLVADGVPCKGNVRTTPLLLYFYVYKFSFKVAIRNIFCANAWYTS